MSKINYLYTCSDISGYGAIVSVPNFASPKECNDIISTCERFGFSGEADEISYAQSTIDIEVDSCPPLRDFLISIDLIPRIQHYMLSVFETRITAFDDVFVVKYDARQQRDLVRHFDAAHLSFMLMLSPASAYTAGGTHFDVLAHPNSDSNYGSESSCVSPGGVVRLDEGVYCCSTPHSSTPRWPSRAGSGMYWWGFALWTRTEPARRAMCLWT